MEIVYKVFIKFLPGLGIECSIKVSEVKIIKIYSVFVKFIVAIECSIMYSHLSNKREITLTDFEKKSTQLAHFHPPHLLIS